jgi:hypothetical protein
VPGRVVALGDDGVDAGLELPLGLARLADQPPDLDAARVGGLENEDRASEARGEHRHLLVQDHLELLARHVLGHPTELVELRRVLGRRDVVPLLDVLGVGALRLGDLRLELLHRADGGDRRGEHQVDPEGPIANPLADPLDVRGDLVRRVVRLAHHRERTGVGDGHDHVLAVGERDDRVLDAERVAEPGVERVLRQNEVPFLPSGSEATRKPPLHPSRPNDPCAICARSTRRPCPTVR